MPFIVPQNHRKTHGEKTLLPPLMMGQSNAFDWGREKFKFTDILSFPPSFASQNPYSFQNSLKFDLERLFLDYVLLLR